MKLILDDEGRAALRDLMNSKPLLAFDFDGTLAPIVPHPDEARVPLPVARRLQYLAARLPVAIVTGRAIADVESRLGFSPHHILGNHGIENPLDAAHGDWARALDDFRVVLHRERHDLAAVGLRLEDKGLSIALHYRLAPDRSRAVARVEALLLDYGRQLKVVGGKCVFNITAAEAPDKGDALLALVRSTGAGCALFVGDDLNDEAVFAKALPDWVTVRIGRNHPGSRARYYLDVPAQLPALLDTLIDLANAPERRPWPRAAAPRSATSD